MAEFNLPAEVTLKSLEAFKETLDQYIVESEIVLNATELTRIDSAGIQLLLIFNQFCKDNNKKLSLSHVSEAMKDRFKLLGTDQLIEM